MMLDFRVEAMALLRYDPATGDFIWKVRQGRQPAGSVAGTRKDGYVQIGLLGRVVRAQRLAWLFMTGNWPPAGMKVDHENRVRSDNRWSNLRLADDADNTANQSVRSDNTSGYPGIYAHRNGRFYAHLYRNNKRHSLGGFPSLEAAIAARRAAEAEHFGAFAPNHGGPSPCP